MNAPFHVTCAIPRSGRTLNNFLKKLVDLGVPSEEIDSILQILSQSKSRSSLKLNEALDFLEEVRTNAPNCFSVFIRKRFHRPYRLDFRSRLADWALQAEVEGEEPHNGSSLIRLDEVDFTVVGLDELLSMTQYYLIHPGLLSGGCTITIWKNLLESVLRVQQCFVVTIRFCRLKSKTLSGFPDLQGG